MSHGKAVRIIEFRIVTLGRAADSMRAVPMTGGSHVKGQPAFEPPQGEIDTLRQTSGGQSGQIRQSRTRPSRWCTPQNRIWQLLEAQLSSAIEGEQATANRRIRSDLAQSELKTVCHVGAICWRHQKIESEELKRRRLTRTSRGAYQPVQSGC